jgi:hypothetical protein
VSKTHTFDGVVEFPDGSVEVQQPGRRVDDRRRQALSLAD